LKSIGINFADVIWSGDAIAMSKLTLKFLAPSRVSHFKFVGYFCLLGILF